MEAIRQALGFTPRDAEPEREVMRRRLEDQRRRLAAMDAQVDAQIKSDRILAKRR